MMYMPVSVDLPTTAASSDENVPAPSGGIITRIVAALCLGVLGAAMWNANKHPQPLSALAQVRDLSSLHPQALYEADLPSVKEEYYSWTWADSGENTFGHDFAEIDPLRWSDWLSAQGMVAELREYQAPKNSSRKVQVIKKHTGAVVHVGGNNGKSTVFPDVGAAIRHFHKLAVARKENVRAKLHEGKLAKRSMVKVLIGMAAGSAITFTVGYLLFSCSKSRKPAKQPAGLLGDSSDEEAPATSGLPRVETFDRAELDRLLDDIGDSGPTLALTASAQGDSQTRFAKLSAEAAKEVERVLAARDAEEIFGGSVSQHRSEYRRLVRLLHPDKRIISGERAALALRRVVEAHNKLEEAGR